MTNSLAYKAADLEWSRDLAKKQEEIEQKKKELDLLYNKLDSIEIENFKDRKKIESNIERIKVDLKYLKKSHKKELSEKERDFYEEISKDIEDVIGEYGKENGFDYIVNESSPLVVYTDIGLDITGEMLIKYNKYWESKHSLSGAEEK